MAKNGFKVGDQVWVLTLGCHMRDHGINVGDVVTVTALAENTAFARVEVNGDNNGGLFYNENRFELVTPNGVDASGKPLFFSVSQLQPGMRVLTSAARYAIVTGYHTYKGEQVKCVAYEPGDWDVARFGEEYSLRIVEVYEAPTHPFAHLNPQKFGALLWKEDAQGGEKAKAKREADTKVEQLRKELAETEAALAAAEAARKALGN